MRHLSPFFSLIARRAFSQFAIVVVALAWATVSVLSASGDPDPTFNGTGKAMFDFRIKGAQARDVTIQTDGKTVASGNASHDANIDLALPRLLPASSPIIVNSTADAANGTDGLCTLREAIQAANSNTASGAAAGECAAGSSSDSDTINFSVTGTITLLTALPDLLSSMSIDGPGASLVTVQRSTAGGTANFRIFTTTGGLTARISGITISNGRSAAGDDGGAIFNQNSTSLTLTNVRLIGNATVDGSSFRAGFGGAISNRGILTLVNSTVSGNFTGKGFSGGVAEGGRGGGIHNSSAGVLRIINSAITGNATGNGAPGCNPNFCDGDGGGIYNVGSATLVNTTISGNTTSTGNSNTPGGQGAGIFSSNPGTLTLQNCTVAGNTASNGVGGSSGGGISATVTLRNTIVAGNIATSSPDLFGTVFSEDYNLIGNTSGASITGAMTNNLPNVDPKLGQLANNGGPTQTMLPLPGSPAINAGNPTNLPPDTFDLNNNGNTTERLPVEQRGFERVAETNFDIGAVETNYSAPVLFVEDGTNRLAAMDSVTLVRGPFRVLSEVNFSADKHTRILFFTSNLGMTQPNPSLTVEAGGIPLEVEAVGLQPNNSGLDISYVIVRLADGLPIGSIPLIVTRQGARSFSGTIQIDP